MQIFIHDLAHSGPIRDTDAEMATTASDAVQAFAGIPGLSLSGVRMFIERIDGVDKGLLILEDVHFNGKEFPTDGEMDALEDDIRSTILAEPGVVSVGSIRFHCITELAT